MGPQPAPRPEDAPAGAPSAAATPSLAVAGLSLRFGGLKVLTGVSFDVAPGSITAVIGPNGAGKTSLFNCISGFYRPQEGTIAFEGEAMKKMAVAEYLKNKSAYDRSTREFVSAPAYRPRKGRDGT